MSRDQSPVFPSNIEVVFLVRRCAGKPYDPYPTTYTKTIALADAGFPDLAGAPGTLTLRSEALALYSAAAGPPTNQAALDALALQMATDFVSWRSASFDRVYNGVIAPDLSGLVDEIEWRYDAVPIADGSDEDSAEDGFTTAVTTRVRSAPFNGSPEEYQHLDPATAGCVNDPAAKTPCVEVYVPGSTAGTFYRRRKCIEGGRQVVYDDGKTDAVGCGCVPACNPATITFTVGWCLRVPGATVVVKDSGGTTVAFGTTNSSGQYTTGTLPCGSYTYTVSLAGWVGSTGSVGITGSNVTRTVPIRPATLHLTDANTTIALTYDTPSNSWGGCYIQGGVASLTQIVPPFPPGGLCSCQPTTISVPISYGLSNQNCSLTQGSCGVLCSTEGLINPPSGCGICDAPGTTTLAPGTGTCVPGFACDNVATAPSSVSGPTGTVNPLNLSYTITGPLSYPCLGEPSGTITCANPAGGGVTITL